MSEKQRKLHSAQYKAKVAIEAVRGIKTHSELALEFGMHPTQIGLWKKELQDHACSLFEAKRGPKSVDASASPERLHTEIGRLKMDLDWLKKSLDYPCHDGRSVD